jgi:hypothetical protein
MSTATMSVSPTILRRVLLLTIPGKSLTRANTSRGVSKRRLPFGTGPKPLLLKNTSNPARAANLPGDIFDSAFARSAARAKAVRPESPTGAKADPHPSLRNSFDQCRRPTAPPPISPAFDCLADSSSLASYARYRQRNAREGQTLVWISISATSDLNMKELTRFWISGCLTLRPTAPAARLQLGMDFTPTHQGLRRRRRSRRGAIHRAGLGL